MGRKANGASFTSFIQSRCSARSNRIQNCVVNVSQGSCWKIPMVFVEGETGMTLPILPSDFCISVTLGFILTLGRFGLKEHAVLSP